MSTATVTKPVLRPATRLLYDPSDWDGEFEGVEERFFEILVGDDRYDVGTNFADAKAVLAAVTRAVNAGAEVWPCSWTVERTDGYECDFPGDKYVPCGAPTTEDPDGNGWTCFAGHSHRSDLEYFDEEEIAGRKGNLPINAARMDGRRINSSDPYPTGMAFWGRPDSDARSLRDVYRAHND